MNTFKHDFTQKYDLILTNPPYGGDKVEKSNEITDNEKILSYIKTILTNLNDEYKQNETYQAIVNDVSIKNKHKQNISEWNSKIIKQIIKQIIE